MSRVFQALTAEPWAIIPDELHKLSAIAQRHPIPGAKDGEPEYSKRDYQLMAGPGAQKLAGAQRAYVIEGVAIIPITGPIFPRANMMTEMSGATSITSLQNDHRVAMANAEIGAIMLLIDSPGGAVSGVSAFADMVAAGAKTKPTVAHVSGTAASAAYWIATQTGEIALDRTGIVGSIGVAAAIPKQVAPDGDGYVSIEIVSSNAQNKRPDPTSEDGVTEIRTLLDGIESQFIGDVAKGRKVSTDKVVSDFGQGGLKEGPRAKSAGMVDKIQSQDATLNGLRRMVANQRKLAALKSA
jgi:ClpP class serine protease